ncbi:MAG: response regulator [Terriglobia bacterium]
MARTVLVADDSPTHQRKANGILTGEGLQVVTVSNGVAAIKKLPTVKPMVVLADVSMPGKDGYEVCEFVKNSPDLAHVPVLLIISDMEPYDEERAARVRADGTIKKPFVQEELVSAVTKMLAQAEAAAPKPQPPAPVMAHLLPAPLVMEPVDVEPEISTRPEGPELGALSEGAAFAEAVVEEVPAAALEAAPPVAEPMMEVPVAPEPEAAPPAVEPALEAEVAPEPEAAPPAEAEAVPAEQPPAEVVPTPEEAPIPAEPVLIEEAVPFAPPPPPETAGTMVFRAPAEIAEPVLSDELAPAPAVAEAPAEPVPEAAPPEVPPVAATTLESFSLTEATAGQVRFAAAPEVEAVPEAEAAAPAPAPEVAAAPAPAAAIDASLIFGIVHRVVLRMAPPALPPQAIDDIVRQLADEILAELGEAPPQSQ